MKNSLEQAGEFSRIIKKQLLDKKKMSGPQKQLQEVSHLAKKSNSELRKRQI